MVDVATAARRATSPMVKRPSAIGLTAVGPEDDVVDIGCGSGAAVRRAARRGASSVVGVDPATVMLRVARLLGRSSRRNGSAVRYVDAAAEALPLADGSASVVWALATVHHWRGPHPPP